MKSQTAPRHRIDWVRLQRDYATGRFTDRELAVKYDTARSVVNRRRKADRAKSAAAWPIDRSEDVRRATAALLMHEQVARNVATGADSESVLAAATMAKDVILRHRAAARRGREVTNALLAELADVTERGKPACRSGLQSRLPASVIGFDLAAIEVDQMLDFIGLG